MTFDLWLSALRADAEKCGRSREVNILSECDYVVRMLWEEGYEPSVTALVRSMKQWAA